MGTSLSVSMSDPRSRVNVCSKTDVAGLDEDATLAAVEGNEHTAAEVEMTRLLLAAHWADLHPGDAVDPHGLPGGERAVQPGGEGTPEIADFAAAELGCCLKTTAGSAKRLIADALDLRHRLPMTWAAARGRAGAGVSGPPRRHATRHLTWEQAAAGRRPDRAQTRHGLVRPAAGCGGRVRLRRRPRGGGRGGGVGGAGTVRPVGPQQRARAAIDHRQIRRRRRGLGPRGSPGWPTSSAATATPTRSTSAARKRSGSLTQPA